MKRPSAKSAAIFGFIIIAAGCGTHDKPVNISALNPATALSQYMAPPSQKNVPLIDQEIDTRTAGSSVKQHITFKYPGTYSVDVITGKQFDYRCTRATTLEMKLRLYDGDKTAFVRPSQRPYIEASNGYGLAAIDFYVPYDVKVQKDLTAVVTVIAADKELSPSGRSRVILRRTGELPSATTGGYQMNKPSTGDIPLPIAGLAELLKWAIN